MKSSDWFLQNKALRYPTEHQLSRWEDDGGNQAFFQEGVLVNGKLCFGMMAKIRHSFQRLTEGVFTPHRAT